MTREFRLWILHLSDSLSSTAQFPPQRKGMRPSACWVLPKSLSTQHAARAAHLALYVRARRLCANKRKKTRRNKLTSSAPS